MSYLSDGLNYVAFQFQIETEAAILAPSNFLSTWNQAIEALFTLSGIQPGSNSQRSLSQLIIREVYNDPELGNQFATWSAEDGVIKLNHTYITNFLAAVNQSPLVGEMAQALGQATIAFQQQYAISQFPQVIAWGDLATGLARAIGLYGLKTASGNISSIWSPNQVLPFNTFVYRELTRCYRKKRLGYKGQDYLTTGAATDPDIAYGFCIELFTAISSWSTTGKLLEWATGQLFQLTAFNRSNQEQYNDLILQLALAAGGDISGLLWSWGFRDVNALNALPEGLPGLGSTAAMIMGSRFKQNIDPALVAREENTSNLPGFVLGGYDNFGMGQSTGTVLVLLDNPPADMVSFKGLNSVMLAGYESNQLPVELTVSYNVGDTGNPEQVLLVPFSMTGWKYSSYVSITPDSTQTLVPCRLFELGNPSFGSVNQTVTTWDSLGNEITQTVAVQVYVYAIIAYEGGKFYNYVNNLGSQVAQVITVMRYPLDKFKDPNTGNIIDNTGGWSEIIKTMITEQSLGNQTLRSFLNTTLIMDSTATVQASLLEEIPIQIDPIFSTYRERPISEDRPALNLLGSVGDPITSEIIAIATRSIGSSLAVVAGVSVPINGYQTLASITKLVQKASLLTPVQVVNLPASIITAVQTIQTYTTLSVDDKTALLQQAYDQLPDSIKATLTGLNLSQPVMIPQLDGTSLDSGWIPTTEAQYKSNLFSTADTILKIAKNLDPNSPLPQQNQAALQRYRNLQDQLNQTNAAVGQPNFLRDLLYNGLAGAARTNNDPTNPLTYLNGTFMSDVISSLDFGHGGLLGILDLSKNPRASAGIISHLIGAAIAAVGIETYAPGTTKNIMQDIQDGLVNIAVLDKPPAQVAIGIFQDMASDIIINGTFKNDPEAKFIARQAIDFLGGLAQDFIDGKMVVHDSRDALNVKIDNQTMNLNDPLHGSQDTQYLNVALGLATATFSNNQTPQLAGLISSSYGDSGIFQGGTPTLSITSNSPSSNINFFGSLVGSIGNSLGITQNNFQYSRGQRTQGMLNQLNSQQAQQASTQNLKSALIKMISVDQALNGVTTNNTKDSNIINSTKVWDFNGPVQYFNTDPAKQIYDAGSRKSSSLPSLLTGLTSAVSSGKAYSGIPLNVVSVFDRSKAERDGIKSPLLPLKDTISLTDYFNNNPNVLNAILPALPTSKTIADSKLAAVTSITEENSGKKYIFEMMPAVRSAAKTDGMQAPGVNRGIQLKTSLNIAKLNVPGGSPIYQVMGINEEFVEFVGCFFGWANYNNMITRKNSQFEDIAGGLDSSNIYDQHYRGYQESKIIRDLQLGGSLLTLRIQSYAGLGNLNQLSEEGIQIEVQGYIVNYERFAQRDDRVWYNIIFRITNHNLLKVQRVLQSNLIKNSRVAMKSSKNSKNKTIKSNSQPSNSLTSALQQKKDNNGTPIDPPQLTSQLPSLIVWGNPNQSNPALSRDRYATKTFDTFFSPQPVLPPAGVAPNDTLGPPLDTSATTLSLGTNSNLYQNP